MSSERKARSANFNNLKDLLKEAFYYQYADISDTEEQIVKKKPKLFFTKIQWFIILFAILVNIVIRTGYNLDFCGYVISGLSLFVGIFFTFIIALYDKFNAIDFSQYRISVSEDKCNLGVRLKNYFKKTTVLSLYLILLSIVCILFLSCTLLFDSFLNQDINLLEIFQNIRAISIIYFFKALVILLYRSIVFYFLIDFVLITIYLTSSIYDFIISEYNKVKLQ